MMKYKKIPNTQLNISVISLGTWVFGGDAWGSAEDKECVAAVLASLDGGINLIDTAPIYGYGRSEELLGRAIQGKRDKIILATKCGLKGRGQSISVDLTPRFIREEIERSLKRLGTDYIDLYQCHWPDANTPVEETMAAMNKLKEEGKIRYIGVSNFSLKEIKEAKRYAEIVSLQSHYSLLERSLEKDILPYCRQTQTGILSYGGLGGGILTGKYKSEPAFKNSDARSFFYKFYKGGGFQRAKELIRTLEEISARIKRPLNQIALNWLRQNEALTSAIVGCRNAEQARANSQAGSWELSSEDLDRLNRYSDD